MFAKQTRFRWRDTNVLLVPDTVFRNYIVLYAEPDRPRNLCSLSVPAAAKKRHDPSSQ